MKLFSSINKSLRRTSVKVGLFAGLLLAAFAVWFGGSARSVDLGDISDPIYCNDSAIIRCGARSTDVVKQKYNDDSTKWGQHIRDVFKGFGISSSDVDKLGETAVAGVVTRDGKVMIGDQVVATNAITAGYVDVQPGSTGRVINNTEYYERPIHVNISAQKSPAFVVMKDNKFDYAIIGTCGNPVSAEPKMPEYTIKKEVQKKGDSTWSKHVSGLKSGDVVTFRVTYWNNGPIDIKNVVQKDALPEGLEYVDGSLSSTVPSLANAGKFFGDGVMIANNKTNTGVSYIFDAVVAPGESVMECENASYKNKAYQSAPGLPNQEDYAKVSKECDEKPVFTCKSLQVDELERTKFRFKVNYAIAPATLKNVIYTVTKDGQEVDKVTRDNFDSVDYTQTEVGDYKVSAKIVVTFEGKEYTAGGTCEGNFTVKEEPSKPEYKCESLEVTRNTRTTFTFAPTIPLKDATIKTTVYTVKNKDGQVVDTITRTDDGDVNYPQDVPGDYTVELVVTVTVDGEDKIAPGTCEGNFTVEEEPKQPVYECTSLSINKVNRTTFTFIPKANYDLATFKSATYTITDSEGNLVEELTEDTLNNITYVKNEVGTYDVNLVMMFDVDGEEKSTTQVCEDSFTVDEEPEVPVYECTSFTVTPGRGLINTTFTYSIAYVADGGADLTRVDVEWGDGSAVENIALGQLGSFPHKFTTAGDFTQTATLTFTVEGESEKPTVTCETSVTVEEEEEEPKVLHETGAGSVAGMFAATSVAGMLAYRFVWLRRFGQ